MGVAEGAGNEEGAEGGPAETTLAMRTYLSSPDVSSAHRAFRRGSVCTVSAPARITFVLYNIVYVHIFFVHADTSPIAHAYLAPFLLYLHFNRSDFVEV